MVAAIASMASIALPPSARMARPASTAAWWGAHTAPRRCPAVWRSMAVFLACCVGAHSTSPWRVGARNDVRHRFPLRGDCAYGAGGAGAAVARLLPELPHRAVLSAAGPTVARRLRLCAERPGILDRV